MHGVRSPNRERMAPMPSMWHSKRHQARQEVARKLPDCFTSQSLFHPHETVRCRRNGRAAIFKPRELAPYQHTRKANEPVSNSYRFVCLTKEGVRPGDSSNPRKVHDALKPSRLLAGPSLPYHVCTPKTNNRRTSSQGAQTESLIAHMRIADMRKECRPTPS